MAVIGDKYIFIHIHKTAGKSVRAHLRAQKDDEWGGVHVEAKQVKKHLFSSGRKSIWDRSFKFAFVRSPYMWLSSLYEYIKYSNDHPDYVHTENGFYDFLLWLVDEGMNIDRPDASNKYLTLTDFLYDHNRLLVDFVGKVENFEHDIKCVHLKLKTKYQFWHLNRNPYARNKDLGMPIHLTTREINLINDRFKEDFENFNYELQ